ncbi:MAG: phosphodiester glycosidase family protein [Muribaculaceae bacterium]|nr:phosphodiester glycosidase family protein [Muribaculaceae bacterium]
MIRKITSLLFLCIAVFGMSSQNTIQILDKTYQVDTLFHATVGPGTTQTSLLLSGAGNLRVFYLTIDLTNPTLSIRTVCATDKVAGNETTSGMAIRKTTAGATYFGGVNGDFFSTSGTTTSGSSKVGTPTAACIVDGEIYKTSSANKQFAIDVNGLPFIGLASFANGTMTLGDNKVMFKGVNVGSPNDAVTIYTTRYYGSTNQASKADACAEVTAKLVEGETFAPGKSCKMEITSVATSTGDLKIPDGEFVIHGRGTSTSAGGNVATLDFVKGMKIGDIVTIESKVTIDGTEIVPQQMISGNPRTVGDGQTLDSEGERADASSLHPRTGIGYGANKTKVIMMVIDGRSTISQGVRTSQFADVMRYAGATDAINLDGGGSAALYTRALGIRNVPSDGKERADGNAVYVVTSAPEDTEIAMIQFKDWAMKFPKNGVYVPQFYGYNKYGVMVDSNLQGVTLSCPDQLGHIENLSTFVGSGDGTYALTGDYKGIKTTIPVTIVETDKVATRLDKIVHDSYRNYTIEVQAAMGETMMPISSSALTWSSDDPSIVEIDAKTGAIKCLQNGTTTVHGVVGATTVSSEVTVQIPSAKAMAIDPNLDVTTWGFSQSGGKGLVATAMDNGFKLDYVGNGSSRGANIKMTKSLKLWSLPDVLRLRINQGETDIKSIVVSLTPNNSGVVNTTLKPTFVAGENVIELSLEEVCDAKDLMNYPITFNSMTFNMGASASGKAFTIEVPGFETIYNSFSSVEGIETSTKGNLKVYPNPVMSGENLNVISGSDSEAIVKLYTTTGQLVASGNYVSESGVISLSTSNLIQGLYLVEIVQDNTKRVSTIIVK